MECKLACFDAVVDECGEHNPLYSKLRHRLLLRLICNATETGLLEETMGEDVACYQTSCLQVYLSLISSTNDREKQCSYFEELWGCPFPHVSESCPQRVADFYKLQFMADLDTCNPEASPLNMAFNNTDYQCSKSPSFQLVHVETVLVIVMLGSVLPCHCIYT